MAFLFSGQHTCTYSKFKQTLCSNCGVQGHHYKYCTEPITSYGILAFRIPDANYIQQTELLNGTTQFSPKIEYLLVQRRDSIGFIELLRSKYKLNDIDYIKEQIEGTTEVERQSLLTLPFDTLWFNLWGGSTIPENKQYKQEYESAKQKFESLTSGFVQDGTPISLSSLIQSSPLQYETPEWGFPKGRRNINETNYKCAIREFVEETAIDPSDIHVFENIEPITEIFYGNNNIQYKHVYYIAYIPNHVNVKLDTSNTLMMREIGDIGWFSYTDALQKIRPTNPEKRGILEKVNTLLNLCYPLLIGPI